MFDAEDILYPCKLDNSVQDAKFSPAAGTEPRPLGVCLHTWSYDHQQETYTQQESYGCRHYRPPPAVCPHLH